MIKKITSIVLAATLFCTLSACKKKENEKPEINVSEIAETYASDPNAAAWTMIEGMTLREKIYQLFITTPEMALGQERVTEFGEDAAEALKAHPVGGIVYFGDNILNRDQITKLLKDMNDNATIPLFQAVDEEGGRVSRLGNIEGITKLPPMREVGDSGDTSRAYQNANTLGTELRALGFNVNFAPVADVLINTDNTEIGDRSFGENPESVSGMVENTVRGLRDSGIATAVKHFPGHGSAAADTHTGRSHSSRTYEEMQNAELLPFKAGIMAGTDFVMVSHMINASITKTNMECSMSTNVMTNILRRTMGFPNIIITDSLSMGAITGYYSPGAAVLTAFEAGADMLLMPADLETAVDVMEKAVKSGRVTEMRINESVSRILKVKLERGII